MTRRTPLNPQRPVSFSASLPAPTGGWNARDSLGAMAPLDAPILTNWFPGTTECILRNGYTKYATGFSGQVESVLDYAGGTIDHLFGVCGGNIYDITTGGAIGAAVFSGLLNSRVEHINVATSGGNFLLGVDGEDKMIYFDGTTWSQDGGTYTVTGVDTAQCAQINLFKNRVWLIQKGTLVAWYLPTSSIAGAANQVDLSSIANKGGYLVAMATWTIDAGQGVDDYAVFVTSRGQVIVYQGTDPASSATWSLKGVWNIGSPVGRRCFLKFSGDILIICQDGVYPMSGALQSSRVNPKVALTDKIQYATSNSISAYGGNFGWQLCYFPRQNQLWLNVPVQEGQNQLQYVMNTINKSWCNYSGWEANCWTLYQDDPYFGGNGYVGLAWNGLDDAGSNINADGLQAFNYFGKSGILKRWTMAKPILRSNGSPAILVNLNIDFSTEDTTAPLSFSGTSYATWDSGIWDSAVWGGDLSVIDFWQGVNGVGECAGVRMKTSSQGIETRWVSTTIVMESGGIL